MDLMTGAHTLLRTAGGDFCAIILHADVLAVLICANVACRAEFLRRRRGAGVSVTGAAQQLLPRGQPMFEVAAVHLAVVQPEMVGMFADLLFRGFGRQPVAWLRVCIHGRYG